MRTLVGIWLVPPALNILLLAIGLLTARWHLRLGTFIAAFGLLSLWLLSTPYISSKLHAAIEQHPALDSTQVDNTKAKAIIVLGSSHYDLAKEYGVSTPTPDSLARLHYATNLHNRTGIPILLTGGPMNARQDVHSEVLSESLSSQFGIKAKWLERKSTTTWQNAIFSADILHPIGVTDVLLVTHSYHMQRAVSLFELAGFNVTPAPTHLSTQFPWTDWRFWMPTIKGLETSNNVTHELLGIAWYEFKSPVANAKERELRLHTR